ncbi:Polypyrimidine tract-binding protein 2 [Cichlidogyrus casuarinus]|uniref:Polypyrimidine tract-binding protein 2 n=1 Tax=Cichlidogyrus casuarinus TaxID=1844966 RepID=A0ABD2QIR0_9PLAT
MMFMPSNGNQNLTKSFQNNSHEFTCQLIALARNYGYDLSFDSASATINFINYAVSQQANHCALPAEKSHISRVLLVSNLNETKVSPDSLFTLFGVYGDVMRVKIMYNAKQKALIQFATARQAQLALHHLNGKELWGKRLKILLSKSDLVQLPRTPAHGDLTKDYSNSKLHRFRMPNSKNFLNIYSPNPVLHLSNMPDTLPESDLRELFESNGFRVINFRYMQTDKKMALLQLGSTDIAMQALIVSLVYFISHNLSQDYA